MRSSAVAYLIGLVWFTGFISGMGYMIVASTVYITSFVLPKTKLPFPTHPAVPYAPMTVSSCLMIRYHMGTAAFGSLVLTVSWFLRMVVNFLAKLAGDRPSYVCCCCNCATVVFRDCLRYMNKLAYLQTVLHGDAFCDAAFRGLQCVVNGMDDIGTTTYISSFVLVVIKLTISLICAAFADLFIKSGSFGVSAKDITYSWVPYVIVGVSAYAVATAFMMILDVAIDALLVGWCEAMVPVYEDNAAGQSELQVSCFQPDHISKALKAHMDDPRWNREAEEDYSLPTSAETKDAN